MKRLAFLFLLVVVATTVCAQKNNLFWSMRVKVKMDKKLEWEKKAPLFMKTHYPQYKFRVYETLNGDYSGSYVIVFGPVTYKDLDAPPVFPKGEQVMKTDRLALDALCESLEVIHFRRDDEISTLNPARKINYILVTDVEFTFGMWPEVKNFITKRRDAAKTSGINNDVDFFRSLNTGIPNSYASVRYLEKLGELDSDENFAELYDKIHGNAAWYKDFNNYLSYVKSVKRELRMLRTDLSSPNPSNVASVN